MRWQRSKEGEGEGKQEEGGPQPRGAHTEGRVIYLRWVKVRQLESKDKQMQRKL